MNEAFDPYYKWLGIRPEEQPPHHYRLLALSLFEADEDVIASAADQRMAHLRGMQTGKHAALSQRLLNEISAAKICLLNADKKAVYDRQLRAKTAVAAPAPAPAVLAPVAQPPAQIAAAAPLSVAAPLTSANPLEDLLAGQTDGRAAAPKRAARPKPKNLPLPVMVAGGLTVAIAGAVAIWLLGAGSEPTSSSKPDGIAAKLHSAPSTSDPPAAIASGNNNGNENTWPASAKTAGDNPVSRPVAAADDVGQAKVPSVDPAGPDTDMEEEDDETDDTDAAMVAGSEEAPAAGERPAVVDLLKLIDPARDAVVGVWKLDGGALVSPANGKWTRLQVPYSPPPAYQWTTVVERIVGKDSVSLGMVVGTSQPQVFLDGWNNQKCGIAMLDGRWGDQNETTVQTTNLLQGGPHTIVCCVHPDQIEVQVDQRKLIDWHGDSRRLSIDPRTSVPKSDRLFLVTYLSSYRITKMEIEPLETAVPVSPTPNPPVANPPGTTGPVLTGPAPFPPRPTVVPRPPRVNRPAPGTVLNKPAVKRVPPPDAGAREKAQRLVADIFQADLAAAKKGENRVPLARQLLNQARQTGDDPAARYVLLQMSSELAAEGGDLELALSAADELAANYEVEAAAVKLDALAAVVPAKISAGSKAHAVELALRVADACVEADDYDRAAQAAKMVMAIAHTSKDAGVSKIASRRSKEIGALAKSFEAIGTQLAALRRDPGDADANLAVGKWYCLTKEDWDKGLPLLAAGSDPELKAVAALEQLKPTGATEMAHIADLWWSLSEQQPDAIEKKSIAKRAVYWYAAAEPQLQGLAKVKAQQRLSAGPRIHKTIHVSAKTCIGNAARTLPAAAASGIEVRKGQRVTIRARGKWQLSKKGKPVGAERLVVAVGSADKPALQTVSGDQQEFTAQTGGELFLGIHDSSPSGNSGHMEVEIEVK
jgi:hypothetical protein